MTNTEPTEGMLGTDFVEAYNSRGERQTIPWHWLTNPVISKGFTTEPPTAADVPSMKWTRDDLVAHAQTARVYDALTEAVPEPTKAQLLAAIEGQPIPDIPA